MVPGETGVLVEPNPISASDVEPRDPSRFARELAEAVNHLLANPGQLRTMGVNARRRVEQHFSWTSIAGQTLAFYEELVAVRRSTQSRCR